MFGTVDIKCRPLKLAYLVEPNKTDQIREAIRLSSSLWGGTYFPIVTLYKRMPLTWKEKHFTVPPAKEVILGYLEAFDPDILVQLSTSIPKFISDTGLRVIKPKEVWANVGERGNYSPQFGIGILEILEEVFDEHFRVKTKYPLRVIIPQVPQGLSLFWAGLFGEIPANIINFVQDMYSGPLEIQDIDPEQYDLTELMKDDVLFPRRVTQLWLKHVNRSGFPREAGVYFLDATKPEDIVDFWNLRALGGSVIPLPKQLKDNLSFKNFIVDFLRSQRHPREGNPKSYEVASIIRSRNCTMEEVEEYAESLTLETNPGEPSDAPLFSLQNWYPRFWLEWARNKAGELPDDAYGEEASIDLPDSEKLTIRFRTLLPKFAYKHTYRHEPRCANEVSFRFHGASVNLAEAFPKFSGRNFNYAVSGDPSFLRDWRVGRNGLVKLVQYETYETKDLPVAERLFFSWLADLNWNPKLSSGGLLAKQIYKKLGGGLGVLKYEKLLSLLEHMSGGQVARDGNPPLKEDRATQERDLPVGEVRNKLKDLEERNNIHEYLVSRGIFKLGLKVQCPHCIRRSWLSLESLEDNLSCPKCLNTFLAIGNVDRAKWHYKTVGPFSVAGYAGGAYAVLLAFEFFSNRRQRTLRTTPVLSFTAEGPNKKEIEADFAMFWEESLFRERNEGLLFAECKTYNTFDDKDWDRMRLIGKTFPGAVLAFCTLRKSLTRREVAEITRIAKAGRKPWKPEHPLNPVLVLTGTELLSWFGPPNCWEQSIQHKFPYTYGLLGLCDFTQQLYLNLPSWHEERERKREAKRQRSQSKAKIST